MGSEIAELKRKIVVKREIWVFSENGEFVNNYV